MEYTIIEVPDMNDSISRIDLLGEQYQIRFTYIDTFDYWTFGIMDALGNPIRIGTKIVPNMPLNIFWGTENAPWGAFGVLTNEERIGRQSFVEGKAQFIFAPA